MLMLSEADFQLQQLVEVDSSGNQLLYSIEHDGRGDGYVQGWPVTLHTDI